MNRLFLLFAGIVAALLVAACGDSTTATDTDTTDTTTTTSNGEDISGSWSTGCISGGGGGGSVTITFSGSTATFSISIYTSVTDCSGTDYYTEDGTASLAFVSTKTMSSGETASTMDITDTANTITPGTDAAASDLNSLTWYGYADWAAGSAKDVLGINDDGSTFTVTADNDVIYVDETVSPNTMQFGLEADDGGTVDSDGYPDDLDSGIFEKQ